jgi:hypothetical protein
LVAAAAVLGRNPSWYQIEEILTCWLVFSLAFVSLALAGFAVILVFGAGKYVIQWTRTAARVISAVALHSSEIHPGMIPAENRSKFQVTNSNQAR